MEIVDRPIVDFYRDSLSAACKKDFLWVITLLAREADVEELYSNLRKSWVSLDSITGKYFLFVLAGEENRNQNEYLNSGIFDSQFSFFCEYNDYIKFINNNISLKENSIYYRYHSSKEEKINQVEKNQTIAVNALKDYFSISENDIPCLVFTKLYPYNYCNNVIKIIPISGNDIYGYFKSLFNIIDPLLKEHMKFNVQLKELVQKKKELEIIINKKNVDFESKLFTLKKELLLYADNNVIDDKGKTLLECINTLSYGNFDTPLRSKLNRYIDLTKNYEKKTGRCFDNEHFEQNVVQNITEMEKAKQELLINNDRQNELREKCNIIISEIEKVIGDSKMDKNTFKDSGLSISVNGKVEQVNIALDNATIKATQYVGFDKKNLTELIENVHKSLQTGISADDIEIATKSLEKIDSELKRRKPRKYFLQRAINSLKIIKGTAEFGAAVAALVQFIN